MNKMNKAFRDSIILIVTGWLAVTSLAYCINGW